MKNLYQIKGILTILGCLMSACGLPPGSGGSATIQTEQTGQAGQALDYTGPQSLDPYLSSKAVAVAKNNYQLNNYSELESFVKEVQQVGGQVYPLCPDDDPTCQTSRKMTSSEVLARMNTAVCFSSNRLNQQIRTRWVRSGNGGWQAILDQVASPGTYATVCFLSSASNFNGNVEAIGVGKVVVQEGFVSRPSISLSALGWGLIGGAWAP